MKSQYETLQAQGYGGAGGSGGGSMWKKALLISGLGCAVLVLVGALLMSLGVFRVVTCCVDHGEKQSYLRAAAFEFGEAVHEGDYDRAYGMLDGSKRADVTVEQMGAEFDALGLREKPPMPVDTAHQTDRDGEHFWRLEIDFAAPRGEDVVRLKLRVEDATIDVDREPSQVAIADWEVEQRTRTLTDDPYAEAALDFHRRLRGSDFEGARRQVAMGADWRGGDASAFAGQMEPLVEELAAMQSEEVYGLYTEDNQRVRVELLLTDGDGGMFFIDYYVQRFLHSISGVSEVRPAHGVERSPEKVGDPDDSEGADDDSTAPADGSDEASGAGEVPPEDEDGGGDEVESAE